MSGPTRKILLCSNSSAILINVFPLKLKLMDFIEGEYLEEQMSSINQLTRILTILTQMQNGVGEYLLDRQLLEGHVEPKDL